MRAEPPETALSPARLARRVRDLPPTRRYVVAYSGGSDSTVLLDALARQRAALAPARLEAAHVNHGVAAAAGDWERHCARACAALDVPLTTCRVDAAPAPGESPEARARERRYTALSALLGPGDVLLTAHHLEDQAETVLLALLRGAGPGGLAGMPRCRALGRGWLARPLLDVPRAALREYAAHRVLPAIEDPTNVDPELARGYLRETVLPALAARWPGYAVTLGRAASHQADTAAIAGALGGIDVSASAGAAPGSLSCAALGAMARPRALNALRVWLGTGGFAVPNARRLDAVLAAATARVDAAPIVRWDGVEVRRHRGDLHAMVPLVPAPAPGARVAWRPPAALELTHGRLLARPVRGAGLGLAVCAGRGLEVGFRVGGERVRLPGERHRRTLKALLHAAGVPPWVRERLPLVYVDGRLAAIAGLWVLEGYAAGPGEPGWAIEFEPARIGTHSSALAG